MSNAAVKVGFGALWREAFGLIGANPGPVLLALAALTLVGYLGFWPLSLAVTLYAQYELIYMGLAANGVLAGGYRGRRLVTALGLIILVNIIIFGGALLFVIPGLVLGIKLCVALPALIAEEADIPDALGISWRRTRGNFFTLAGSFVLLWLPYLVLGSYIGFVSFMASANINGSGRQFATAPGGLPAALAPLTSPPFAIGSSLLGTAIAILGWYLTLAFYLRSAPRGDAVADVFA